MLTFDSEGSVGGHPAQPLGVEYLALDRKLCCRVHGEHPVCCALRRRSIRRPRSSKDVPGAGPLIGRPLLRGWREVITGGGSAGGFGVAVSFAGEPVVLAVRGEVDLATVSELGAMLEAVIDLGHLDVVVDLDEVGFMSAAGLRAIELGAARLWSSGGQLTLRSASSLVRRMLGIVGMTGLVRLESPEAVDGHLGPEQSTRDRGTPVRIEARELARSLRRVTATTADDDVVDGALRLVVSLARATVGGADGVSVSLRRHGRLSTVAASNRTISDMDADQYATGEGPCVDASVKGRWFHVESLGQETRWPAFTPRARKLGINAILSTPLMARDRPVGALNIYSRTTGAFSTTDQELASMFATEASTILTDAGVSTSEDELAGRLTEALRAREVIAQAQGVVMEREGLSAEDAYTSLRHFSVRSNRPLRERAEDMVGSAGRRVAPDLALNR